MPEPDNIRGLVQLWNRASIYGENVITSMVWCEHTNHKLGEHSVTRELFVASPLLTVPASPDPTSVGTEYVILLSAFHSLLPRHALKPKERIHVPFKPYIRQALRPCGHPKGYLVLGFNLYAVTMTPVFRYCVTESILKHL